MDAILPAPVRRVVRAIIADRGRPLVAGGAVRDKLLGKNVTDLDFEVYELSAETLIDVLSRFGRVETVGRSFGVVKLWMRGAGQLDFALPRRESKVGRGHRGFLVEHDADMSLKEACARRDFTVNAMLMDPESSEIFDFFGGQKDLSDGVLRHTSEHFSEDPLRALRGMQFAGRFDMTLHPSTAALCRSMLGEAAELAQERIWGEWEKWAVKSTRHSAGLSALVASGWHTLFPGLAALAGQGGGGADRESGGWRHTLEVVDAAARIAERDALSPSDKTALVLAALLADIKDVDGFIRAIGAPNLTARRVEALVRENLHMESRASKLDKTGVRRLARAIVPESAGMLTRVMEARDAGSGEELRELAEQLGLLTGPPKPLLMGRDLIELGMASGPEMGRVLDRAFEAQLDGAFETKEEALAWVKGLDL